MGTPVFFFFFFVMILDDFNVHRGDTSNILDSEFLSPCFSFYLVTPSLFLP